MALIEFLTTPPEQKSLGGVTFLRKNANAAMRSRVKPTRRASSGQQRQRDILRRAGRSWKYDLSAPTQLAWEDATAKINSAPIGPLLPLVRAVDWYSELILLFQTYGYSNDMNQAPTVTADEMQLVQETVSYDSLTGNVQFVLASYTVPTYTDPFFTYITKPQRNGNLASWQRANYIATVTPTTIILFPSFNLVYLDFTDPYFADRTVNERMRVKVYSVIQNFAYYPLWVDLNFPP